ncbi:hypothetical protein GRX01_06605 [Halobaculum sp. WSA2]|uniref:Uncharacterized protein n=1 Tax=Halobaculum saliterrae TaxID=2073113 RepID=A0A6B0SWH1_9EURY|nr:hypothetical protein [Halobaculum saliterrae]MXR41011.1 hypothetical protein [Halobaculum saliterrae]
MAYSNRMSSVLGDYANIRTIPAYLSAAYLLAGLYQFGGIATVELSWLSYTLGAEHAVLVSMGAFVIAFAGSSTRQFENYEPWEQAAIAIGPVVILGEHLTAEATDFLIGLGDPLGMQLAFLATVVSWAVAVR